MKYNFNVEKATNKCVAWIQSWYKRRGGTKAVVGISGGIDSAVVAALCTLALGRENVIGMIIPNGQQKDIDDALCLTKHLNIPYYICNLEGMYDTILACCKNTTDEVSEQTKINLPPRLRMAILFAVAQSNNAYVANTCNLSETYVGYDTLFGDSAGSFAPIAYFTKTEVRKIAQFLGLPDQLINKAPADGLCGQTDEESWGFSYDVLDKFLRYGDVEDQAALDKILDMHRKSEFKRRMIHLEGFCYEPDYIRPLW